MRHFYHPLGSHCFPLTLQLSSRQYNRVQNRYYISYAHKHRQQTINDMSSSVSPCKFKI
jgi:hypothetical protein